MNWKSKKENTYKDFLCSHYTHFEEVTPAQRRQCMWSPALKCTQIGKVLLSLRPFARNSKLNRFCKIFQCRIWWQSTNCLVSCTASQTDREIGQTDRWTNKRTSLHSFLLASQRTSSNGQTTFNTIIAKLRTRTQWYFTCSAPMINLMFGPRGTCSAPVIHQIFGPSDTSHVLFIRRRYKGRVLPCTGPNRLLFHKVLM